MAALRRRPGLEVGDNEPYSARENYGQTIAHHGEAAGLPHLLIEVRQDLIDTPDGAEEWAGIVGDALACAVTDLDRQP
jgi:predicted N-formylglutamate amidohydrolase